MAAVRALVAAALVAGVACGAAAVDKIRNKAGIAWPGEIVGVTAEGLEIKVAGAKRVVPFEDIRSVSSDAYPRLTEAERLYERAAEGDAEAMKQAARLYDALDSSRMPEWVRTVARWRMYGVLAKSGQVRKALEAYLALAKKSPKLVAGLELPRPNPGDPAANKALLAEVEKALKAAPNAPYVDTLENFRVALLLLVGDPKQVLESGVLDKLIQSKDPKVRGEAMLRKLELLLAAGRTDEAVAWFDRIQQAETQIYPGQMAYWKGRVLEAQGEFIKAALAYMRVPILHAREDRARTAEALWRAGKAMEAAKVPVQEVRAVYQEAVNDYPGTTGAERARRELARLGTS